MRAAFSILLTRAAQADKRVLLLTGDHGYALFDEFRHSCPAQYVNCGIAEQNMVGVAAGLAKAGFRPIVYGLAAFVPMRVLEQIKLDVCYESLPVTFVGDGAGLVYAQLGASHQCTEDVAALRAIPNITIASPADRFELKYCFEHLLASDAPGYLRFGKADCGDVHARVPHLKFGDLINVRLGEKRSCVIIATGAMVSVALKVSDSIGGLPVWSAPVICPINADQIRHIASGVAQVFVIEEHSEHGGLGGLCAELIAASGTCKVRVFGTKRFSEFCGDYRYLLDYHGLSAGQLEQALRVELG